MGTEAVHSRESPSLGKFTHWCLLPSRLCDCSFANPTLFLLSQRFAEQKTEDAKVLALLWTADRNTWTVGNLTRKSLSLSRMLLRLTPVARPRPTGMKVNRTTSKFFR